MRETLRDKTYWIAGTLVGLLGVAIVRLLSPGLPEAMSRFMAVIGYLLALSGIVTIAWGIRNRGPVSTEDQPLQDENK